MRTRKNLINLLIVLWLSVSTMYTVHAASPTIPVVSASLSGTTVKLNYNSTSKVSGYEISVAVDNAVSKVIYTGSKTTSTLNKVAYGSVLVFQVRSYTLSRKVKTFSKSVQLIVNITLETPSLNSKLIKSMATLSWGKVMGAKGYEVHRSEAYVGPYALIKTTSTVKYGEKLGVGKKWYYKVRSYVTVNGKKVYSEFSNIVLISN